jgi:DNA recombination protein RmuC
MNILSASSGIIGTLIGLFIGVLLAWLLSRNRVAAQLDAAVSKAELALKGELSELRERVRAADEVHREEQTRLDEIQRQANIWRNELDSARDTMSKLEERSSRVPALETEKTVLERKFENANADLGIISQHKAVLETQALCIPGLEKQVRDLNQLMERLQRELAELGKTHSARVASHEAEQAAHILAGEEARAAKAAQALAESNINRLREELSELREGSQAQISRLNAELKAEQEAHGLVRTTLAELERICATVTTEGALLKNELTELRTRFEEENKAAAAQQQLLLHAKETLSDQFKSLANDILEEKTKRFTEQNQLSLGHLLDPLKIQLLEFKGKVEEVYIQEGKDRSALSEQVRMLAGLNQTLSQEAKNLTSALKGNTKTQGNWGELVLERVLEASGLRKGDEYVVQESAQREDGSRAQADVVINLPEERSLVVDAKVSLLAYEAHANCQSDEARDAELKRHLNSVRVHIQGLSSKKYQDLYGIKSLDFVLMFIPVEPAFMLAVTHDNGLFMDAWNKNVLLVSPSTLLFVVRTVAHLWRQEAQSRNAQEIAKRGGELYNKLYGFVADLDLVGKRLNSAKDAYDDAYKKFATGSGNAIRQAEMLCDLGVKPAKRLAAALIEKAMENDNIVGPAELSAFAASNTLREAENLLPPFADDTPSQ